MDLLNSVVFKYAYICTYLRIEKQPCLAHLRTFESYIMSNTWSNCPKIIYNSGSIEIGSELLEKFLRYYSTRLCRLFRL